MHRHISRWLFAAAIVAGACFILPSEVRAEDPPTPTDKALAACLERGIKAKEANKAKEASDEFERCHARVSQAVTQDEKMTSAGLIAMLGIEKFRAEVNMGLHEWARAASGLDLYLTLREKILNKPPSADESKVLAALKQKAAGGTATPTPSEPEVTQEVNKALELFLAGKRLEALAVIEKIAPKVDSAPASARLAYYQYGGALYDVVMKFTQAETLLNKALAIVEAPGAKPEELRFVLMFLSNHYRAMGDHDNAEKYMLRAKDIADRLGPSAQADVLENLAWVYASKHEYPKALAAAERANELAQQLYKPDDPKMHSPLRALAHVLDETGEYVRAEVINLRNKEILDKSGDTSGWAYLRVLEDLGWHYRAAHDYRKSADFYDKRMALLLRLVAADSIDVANAKCQMAETLWNLNDYARAVPLGIQCNDTKEKYLSSVLLSGSEDQRRAYISTLLHETDVTVSAHVQGAKFEPRLVRFALDTILRRKGRVLDAMADTMSRARGRMSSEDRVRLDRLAAVRSLLASSAVSGGGNPAGLAEEARQLESQLSQASTDFRSQSVEISTQTVQNAVPDGAALVEIVSYRPYDFKAKLSESHAAPEYVAYVLHHTGEASFVVLGKAEPIDREIAQYRDALSNNRDAKALARSLDAKVMAPIRPLLKGAQKVFLSPDGALNLIPFAALVDEQGKYLVESLLFTYVTTGRDLLRFSHKETPVADVTVFANPDYQGSAAAGSTAGSKRSVGFNLKAVKPLPGTAEEAKAIASVLPYAKVLTQSEATEGAVKAVQHPRVLHIATHGFFVGETSQASDSSRSLEYEAAESTRKVLRDENPLLRSGLLFTGAGALHGGGTEDGVLTALEAASLDLRGTGLVVLSACQTAVGEVRSGEGVYGLRRALVIAGAESMVMSLWSVDDDATRDLMSQYYRRLKAGEGRSEALRQVQIAMIQQPKTSSPFYWAAFIPSGDPSPMEFPDPKATPSTPSSSADSSSYSASSRRHGPTPSWSWLRFEAGLARLSMDGTDAIEADGNMAGRFRAEVSLLSHYILHSTPVRFYDSLGGQLTYAGDGKSAKEVSYDAMLGFAGESFGLYAGIRLGTGNAAIGDLKNEGTFLPIAGMMRISDLRITGWGGRLAGERKVYGAVLTLPIGDSWWLDGGYQQQKGRDGESPSANITHFGLGFSP